MTKIKNILLLTVLITTLASCGHHSKEVTEFVDPESFPQYKKCEYDFCYDPLIWYFCLKNDSFVLRHIGYYLPENIRKGNFKDTVPKFPFPINIE